MLEPTVHYQFEYAPIRTRDASKADLFFIPHYSRMCSGLDGEVRWNALPSYLKSQGRFFDRYSGADHFLMHSVPHYGDKPADQILMEDKSPIVALLDLKYSAIRKNPWIIARSLVVPFITLVSNDTFSRSRNVSVYVAMSTATKGMRAASGVLRQGITEQLKNVSDSEIFVINRREYSTFKTAITTLSDRMSRSELCIVPPGDAPSSKRFYDAVSHYCIPFLVTDYVFLPYEDVFVDYAKCVRQLPSRRLANLSAVLKQMTKGEKKARREELRIARERFTWDYEEPPKAGQALWTLSWSLYDRVRMMKPYLNNEMTGDNLDPDFSITVQPPPI
jgi:hypothetical protein